MGNKAKVRWGWAPHAQVGLLQSPLTRTPPSSTRSPWAGCWACGSQWRTPRWRMAASGSSPAPTPVRTPVSPCPLIPYPPWERDPEKREAERLHLGLQVECREGWSGPLLVRHLAPASWGQSRPGIIASLYPHQCREVGGKQKALRPGPAHLRAVKSQNESVTGHWEVRRQWD